MWPVFPHQRQKCFLKRISDGKLRDDVVPPPKGSLFRGPLFVECGPIEFVETMERPVLVPGAYALADSLRTATKPRTDLERYEMWLIMILCDEVVELLSPAANHPWIVDRRQSLDDRFIESRGTRHTSFSGLLSFPHCATSRGCPRIGIALS